MNTEQLLSRFDPLTGELPGAKVAERWLSDLRGCFLDTAAYERALQIGNPLLYAVSALEPSDGDGDLHLGIGRLMPGKIGAEFYMTKGHLHAWRGAAEFYIGIAGQGMMLLEDESTGASQMLPLGPNHIVYVPGNTAHRTMNVGPAPLVYLGIYPAKAGHDYGAIAQKNFRKVVVELNGTPTLLDREELLLTRTPQSETG